MESFKAPVEDSTGDSTAGNVNRDITIMQNERDRLLIGIADGNPSATGYITQGQKESLEMGHGVLQITKQDMVSGRPEYYLNFVERSPANQEESPYARRSLTMLLGQQGYNVSSSAITSASIPKLQQMLVEAYNKNGVRGGRRRKTKKSKRRQRKTRRRHK